MSGFELGAKRRIRPYSINCLNGCIGLLANGCLNISRSRGTTTTCHRGDWRNDHGHVAHPFRAANLIPLGRNEKCKSSKAVKRRGNVARAE